MPLSQVVPENYQHQLDSKADRIRQQFANFNAPELSIYASEPLHYRMRAEFKVWHQDDDTYYVMFRKDQPKTPCRIDNFPIGSLQVNQLMSSLMIQIKQSELLRKRLFQVEFLTTLSGEALVTLIYHKRLDEQWESCARELQSHLNIRIIGRSKKQKLVLDEDFITECLTVDGKQYRYQQVESGFTQPNAGVNQHMLGWALQHSADLDDDLLELYCGNGNFTAVLAQNFNKVLATEISKTSVRSAHYNFALNGVDNVSIVRMSSEDFTSALNKDREFRRLKDINLDDYQFSTVLVDPPRAGLDEGTETLISRFETIIYISCNPNTLYDNLQKLCKTHQLEHFALFDQFPYTDHVEVGVILKRKAS